MVSTQEHQQQHQHAQSLLPPSPPPSPPATRRRHKKQLSDPFLDLGDAKTPIPTPSPPSSPTNEPAEPKEPLLTRVRIYALLAPLGPKTYAHAHKQIILTPLLFTSFLLSLFLVNRSDRARRHTSSSRSSTLLSYFSPYAWIDPEPYQDPTNSTWERRGSTTHVAPHDAISPRDADSDAAQQKKEKQKQRSWHLNKKIRKVARLEISDAFEMRGRVMLGMGVVMVGLVLGVWLSLRWMVGVVLG